MRILFVLIALTSLAAQPLPKTRNVIFVMTDGLRWQEVFRGADLALMDSKNEPLKLQFWRETPEARRQALMPFLWSEIAQKGQIFGNRDKGSDAYVTNGLNFSYPGYSETLCGFADPRITSNDNIPNPNVTVLEWLNRKPAFHGKVAAFGAWEVISAIVNPARAGIVANSGYQPFTGPPATPAIEMLNRLKTDAGFWGDEPLDAFPFHTAREYLKAQRPRVLYLSLGETDDWAHEGNYERYLKAAQRVDRFLKDLWDLAQSIPQYRGSTALIFSVDHGRGEGLTEWRSHGEKVPESKYMWMAFLGPDTPPLGERANLAPVTQSQIAATLAALLGQDYGHDAPRAGKPVGDVLGR